jgi:hypothetical protein
VVEHVRGQVDVVADEVALGEPADREEDLLEVRDRDIATADAHRARVDERAVSESPHQGTAWSSRRAMMRVPAPLT